MKMIIDGVDFHELEAQRYWSFPKSYKGDSKEETRNMIFSGDYIGSRKMDGAFYKFIKDENGNMELLGRSRSVSGDFLDKIEWVPHLMPFFNALPNGTCLLGELYFPNNEGSNKVTTIMGCLKEKAITRQEKNKLHYYVFDCLAYMGKNLLSSDINQRIKALSCIETSTEVYNTTNEFRYNTELTAAIGIINKTNEDYVEFAKYYTGAELWVELQTILSQGGEGIVITKCGTCYQPGKRPARQTLKIKRELSDTIDAFFTGKTTPATEDYKGKEIETWQYWQDIRTGEKFLDNESNTYKRYVNGEMIKPITRSHFYDWAGSLEVGVYNKEGKIVPIAWLSGLPDEIKAAPEDFTMKPFEMTAMQIHEDTEGKGLRHAKFLKWRPDNSLKDCTYEKIFGEQ